VIGDLVVRWLSHTDTFTMVSSANHIYWTTHVARGDHFIWVKL